MNIKYRERERHRELRRERGCQEDSTCGASTQMRTHTHTPHAYIARSPCSLRVHQKRLLKKLETPRMGGGGRIMKVPADLFTAPRDNLHSILVLNPFPSRHSRVFHYFSTQNSSPPSVPSLFFFFIFIFQIKLDCRSRLAPSSPTHWRIHVRGGNSPMSRGQNFPPRDTRNRVFRTSSSNTQRATRERPTHNGVMLNTTVRMRGTPTEYAYPRDPLARKPQKKNHHHSSLDGRATAHHHMLQRRDYYSPFETMGHYKTNRRAK